MAPTSISVVVRLGVVVDGLGFADGRALATDNGIEAETGVRVEVVARRDRLRERNEDGPAIVQAHVILVRDDDGADGRAVIADLALLGIDVLRLGVNFHLEVAHEARDRGDLARRHQRDLRVLRDLHHLRRQDALRAVERREGLRQLDHVAADARQLLDKHDFKAGIGEIERALNARDAAADDHHLARDGKAERGQGLVSARALNRRARDLDRFLGALFLILVHPGALFANVRDFQLERVQAAQRRGVAEGLLVEVRRAAGDDDAIELVLLDGVDDRLLPGVGTHVDVVVREDHALVMGQLRSHPLDIHGRRDVGPAMANEYSGAPCQWTAPFFVLEADSRPYS